MLSLKKLCLQFFFQKIKPDMEQSQVLKNLAKLIFSTTKKAMRKAVFVGPCEGS